MVTRSQVEWRLALGGAPPQSAGADSEYGCGPGGRERFRVIGRTAKESRRRARNGKLRGPKGVSVADRFCQATSRYPELSLRLLVVLAALALAAACCATALAQSATPVPSWQGAADSARFPLLARLHLEGLRSRR